MVGGRWLVECSIFFLFFLFFFILLVFQMFYVFSSNFFFLVSVLLSAHLERLSGLPDAKYHMPGVVVAV